MSQQKTSIQRNIFFLLIVIIATVGVIFFARQQYEERLESQRVLEKGDQFVEQDWISLTVPKVLESSVYTLGMEILQNVTSIEVNWNHSATLQKASHMLEEFQPGDIEAQYKINVDFGNLLPGENKYEIIARENGQEDREDAFVTSFSLFFDLEKWEEKNPDLISIQDLPETTSSDVMELEGQLSEGAESLRVYSYHRDSGKSSFARLNKYRSGEKSFQYRASEELGNLMFGENLYVVEALDEKKKVLSRRQFLVNSTHYTLEYEVEVLFGSFQLTKGGWYVSSRLPWFSLRPVYEKVYYKSDERSVVLPRPTLMYTAEAVKETSLCDYLASIDYQEEGLSYRGYSYETCQKYRYGVSVYDRFLSILSSKPVEVVLRIDYQDISDLASSAFVMIETGGIPEERFLALSFSETDESFETSDSTESTKEDQEQPRYYIFQMLMTEDVEYLEKKIGDIRVEASEERIEQIENVREFLFAHSGDELFSEVLFTGIDAIDTSEVSSAND